MKCLTRGVRPATALRMFDKVIWHLDEPQADPSSIHVYNICMGAREAGVKVLLGGTAGADLFSGYRRHQAIQLEKYYAINWNIFDAKAVKKSDRRY